jgi:cell wall-associated NlpC family hydrolase
VEILDEEGKWVFTRQEDGYLGWAYKAYLVEGKAKPATHLVLAPSYELRARPTPKSPIATRVVSGTGVTVEEIRGKWTRVNANTTGWMPTSLLQAIGEIPKSTEEKCQKLMENSARMIGVPYLWGGASGNGIDCSGFARLLHRWIGVQIPRDADLQYAAAKPVEPPFEVGDLLFFREEGSERRITHVGVSLGGWKMIHSSRGNNGVYIDDLHERESLNKIFAGAGSFLR